MNLIVDASVTVKWFLDEDGSRRARELLLNDVVDGPDLILAETFNAVWKRWKRREAEREQLAGVLPILRSLIGELTPLASLIEPATILSQRHVHPVYDCVYLALAERSGYRLVTADERQFALARQARIEARLL